MSGLEQKNRLIIAATVIVLIVGALFASFGRSILSLRTPSVELPTVDSSGENTDASSSPGDTGQYQKVSVTPDTVQEVISTLSRPGSYYRELTVETLWSGGSYSASVQTWTDGGWSHTVQTLPSGVVRHDLVGDTKLYFWYEGSEMYETVPADERSPDLSQRIPTYETILELPADSIIAADYSIHSDLPCVHAQVQMDNPSVTEDYWVSVDNGLLIAAEMVQDGETVYRMTANGSPVTPCPVDASFVLPDGTQLHVVQ